MNKAMISAYRKGYTDFLAKGDKAVCPYKDKRGGKYNHIVTFSRAFQNYWRAGFEDARDGKPDIFEAA